MLPQFFPSIDFLLLTTDVAGSFKPIDVQTETIRATSNGEPSYTAEARNKFGETTDRSYGPSIGAAVMGLLKEHLPSHAGELENWTREGNSFLYKKRGATVLQLYRGTEIMDVNLLKSYGGDDARIAYINFTSSKPQIWKP